MHTTAARLNGSTPPKIWLVCMPHVNEALPGWTIPAMMLSINWRESVAFVSDHLIATCPTGHACMDGHVLKDSAID